MQACTIRTDGVDRYSLREQFFFYFNKKEKVSYQPELLFFLGLNSKANPSSLSS
jgi:hypothetical protein